MLKWNIVIEKRHLLRNAIIYTLTLLGISVFFRNIINDNLPSIEAFEYYGMGFCIIAFWVFFAMSATEVMNIVRNNTDRMQYLMLPATNLEKFLSRLLHSMVFPLLLFAVALVLADLLHMVVDLIFYHETNSVTLGFLKCIGKQIDMGAEYEGRSIIQVILSFFFYALLLNSSMVFGGCVFRKHPFVLSTLTYVLLAILLGSIVSYIVKNVELTPSNPTPEYFKYLEYAFGVAVCLLFYWLSYCIFVRLQVKNSKLLNF